MEYSSWRWYSYTWKIVLKWSFVSDSGKETLQGIVEVSRETDLFELVELFSEDGLEKAGFFAMKLGKHYAWSLFRSLRTHSSSKFAIVLGICLEIVGHLMVTWGEHIALQVCNCTWNMSWNCRPLDGSMGGRPPSSGCWGHMRQRSLSW